MRSMIWAIALATAPAPHMHALSFEQLGHPLPLPYDEQAVGMAQVNRGRDLARARHKLLLIDLGGNWCLDCRILAGTIELPELKAFVAAHYVVVPVDIGRYDKNLDVQQHYGFSGRLDGVPSLLVIDPRTDRLLNAGHTSALTDARHMSPLGLADYLASWTR